MVYESLVFEKRNEDFRGSLHRVLEATEAHDDFADAALLHETMQRLQSAPR